MSQLLFYKFYLAAIGLFFGGCVLYLQTASNYQFWLIMLQTCLCGGMWDLARENLRKVKLFKIAAFSLFFMVWITSTEAMNLLSVPLSIGIVGSLVVTLLMTSKLISTALQMGEH